MSRTNRNGMLGSVSWAEWRELNEEMISVIRYWDKERIPLVAGFDWAYDLDYLHYEPVRAEGIGYVTHPYPNKRGQPWEPRWEENFAFAADKYPATVATEIGFPAESRARWLTIIITATASPGSSSSTASVGWPGSSIRSGHPACWKVSTATSSPVPANSSHRPCIGPLAAKPEKKPTSRHRRGFFISSKGWSVWFAVERSAGQQNGLNAAFCAAGLIFRSAAATQSADVSRGRAYRAKRQSDTLRVSLRSFGSAGTPWPTTNPPRAILVVSPP